MPQSPWSDWSGGLRQSSLRPSSSSAKMTPASFEWMRISLLATSTLAPFTPIRPTEGRRRHPDRHLTEWPRLPVTSQTCPHYFLSQWPTPLQRCRWQTFVRTCISRPSFSTNLLHQSPRDAYLLEYPSLLGPRRRQLTCLPGRREVMSTTQPLPWCPEASGGLRLVLATTWCPSVPIAPRHAST